MINLEEIDVDNAAGVVAVDHEAIYNDTDVTSFNCEEVQDTQTRFVSTRTFSQKWSNLIFHAQTPVKKAMLVITDSVVRNPKTYITLVCIFSLVLLTTGIFTNFNVEVNEDVLWTPRGCRSLSEGHWVDHISGFPTNPRSFMMLVHANGQSVLGQEGISRVFDAVDIVRSTPGYADVCVNSQMTNFLDDNGQVTCNIVAVTSFWNDTKSVFTDNIQSDGEAIAALSMLTYPDGTPVESEAVFGKARKDENLTLTSVVSYLISINLPETRQSEDFETPAIENIKALSATWAAEAGNPFRLELFAVRSFSDEFTRAIVTDIPLVPIVFVIMSIFTCVVFFQFDWVFSRSLLGFGAVVSVLLAIMSGYGLLFIFGIPFTSMTQILPFIMFGIGLDDAFIISGAFRRTDTGKATAVRIHETMDEVSVAIFLTTLTSVLAFASGCLSSIPAVYWLCLYAIPTICFDLLFQVTFYVALIVIDERRVKDKRKDCLVCFTAKGRQDDDEANEASLKENSFDRCMVWYGDFILRPWVKGIVLLAFSGLLAGCTYSVSQLEQEFKFTDVVPKDSYVTTFWENFKAYTEQSGIFPFIYFRDVDQSNPSVQQQMENYVNDVIDLDQASFQPAFFWLRDFKAFVNETNGIDMMNFNEQMDVFLGVPVYRDLYKNDIVRDNSGNILRSRTSIRFDKVDQEVIDKQITALHDQSDVSAAQLVNQNRKEWAFFTFDGVYYIWEFYSVVANELTVNTLMGVIAVSLVGLIFIPHWSAVLFVFSITSVMYINLLGFLQFCGVKINAVSYISMVMSVGLIVDFLMHPLLRYFESKEEKRDDKIKDTLRTMGVSVLIGGISTFLGVLPLAFSTSQIFFTIFITFIGLVTFGLTHGLILLPVLLSFFGPSGQIGETKTSLTDSSTAERIDTTTGKQDFQLGDTTSCISDSA